MDVVEEILAHHGIKGMKWGVRRKNPGVPTEATLSQVPGKKIKTQGGENQSAHPDAEAAAKSRQIAKKSTSDALSNKELKDLVTRLNLEQQLAQLNRNQKNVGEKFASDLLGNVARQQITSAANQQAAKAVAKILL